MNSIELSETAYIRHVTSVEIRNERHPEYKINAHRDKNQNVRIDEFMVIEEAYQYFEQNFLDIYKDYFPFFITCESEEESFGHAYVLYITYLYKNYKEVPVDYSAFRQWYLDVSFNQKPIIEFVFGADMFQTHRLLGKGERLLRNQYQLKESIERCTESHIALSQQKQLVDSIVACFRLKYEQESDNLCIALLLIEIDADVLIANIEYQIMDTKGVMTRIDNMEFTMSYSHEYYPGWVSQYRETYIDNVEENNNQNVESLNNVEDNPIVIIQKKLDENSFHEDSEFNKYYRSLYDYSKHYWILLKHFLEHEMEVDIYRTDADDEIIINDGIEIELQFENEKFFRKTGEEVYSLDVLSHEIAKARRKSDEEKKKTDERAKQHLFNFLLPEQKETFEKDAYFLISGIEYDFILHKERSFNNILRIDKRDPSHKRSLCITPKDIHISEYDVMATIVLLIIAGKENVINSTANSFPLNEQDEQIINMALKCA